MGNQPLSLHSLWEFKVCMKMKKIAKCFGNCIQGNRLSKARTTIFHLENLNKWT